MTLPSSGPLSLSNIQTEFGGSNPIGMNEYYAGGGLVPAGTTGTYGAVPSSGALSIQNFYGTSQFVPIYIEDVFSTYLYTGTGANRSISNGIDLSTKGGMVWIKDRNVANWNLVFDTARGTQTAVFTNNTNATTTVGNTLTAFNTDGFSLGTDNGLWGANISGESAVSWTFRKQPKFFDIVTWTGNGAATQTISHSLGAAPGCIMAKATSTTGNWNVYHQSLSTPDSKFLRLNTTQSEFTTSSQMWATTTTNFTVYQYYGLNDLNVTYVAYLFAHNAGGFGLTGTDNVISCGSFTTPASPPYNTTVTLGYEPQYVLFKAASGTNASGDPWGVGDVMRGLNQTNIARLIPNSSDAENNGTDYVATPTATGFVAKNFAGGTTYIYIAIRRGPMKVPTDATKVFLPYSSSSTGFLSQITTGFPVDLMFSGQKNSNNSGDNWSFVDRLRGQQANAYDTSGVLKLLTTSTAAEASLTYPNAYNWWNTGVVQGIGLNGASVAYQFFRRAPGFFDEVCDTGTGAAHTVSHNLQAIPELIIRKGRSGATQWEVYSSALANTEKLVLNSTSAKATDTTAWNSTTPTSSVFTVGTSANVNASSATYVTYLFATCAGVSKVGSYTGTGATQTISCGFTGGARFVLIKRADSTGDWYVWDTARGMFSLFDPSVSLNSTAAEVNGTSVYTVAGGFEVVSTAAGINASGGTYIYLAIA